MYYYNYHFNVFIFFVFYFFVFLFNFSLFFCLIIMTKYKSVIILRFCYPFIFQFLDVCYCLSVLP